MSTKSHWRQPALMMAALLGIASGAGPVPQMAHTRYSRRGGSPKHYLRRITNEMLRRGWKPNAKFAREKVR